MTPVQAKKPGGLRISALSQEKIQRLQSLFIILRLMPGSMKDEEKARTFIKEVEQIPGIYPIAVELGFINTSNSALG